MPNSCACPCGKPIPEDQRSDSKYIRGHKNKDHSARRRGASELGKAARFWSHAAAYRRRRPARRGQPA